MAREGINAFQQIGVQSVAGTGVAAPKRLSSIGINLGADIVTKQFRSMAAKANTTSIVHKLMTRGTYEGPLSYNEIIYILAGLMPGVPSTTTGVTTWTFTPNNIGNDTFKLYTLEDGDDEAVDEYIDLLFQSMDISFGLEDVMVSGNIFGKSKVDGGAFTGSPTQIAERPVSARDISIYADETYAGIGTTLLTDAFDARFSIGDKFDPKWVLNRGIPSYKEPFEKIPEMTFTLTIEANAQGRALFTDLITLSEGRFFRIECQSPDDIPGGTPATKFSIEFDFFAKVTGVREMKDYQDALWAYELTFTLMQESTLGRPFIATVVNGLAAL